MHCFNPLFSDAKLFRVREQHKIPRLELTSGRATAPIRRVAGTTQQIALAGGLTLGTDWATNDGQSRRTTWQASVGIVSTTWTLAGRDRFVGVILFPGPNSILLPSREKRSQIAEGPSQLPGEGGAKSHGRDHSSTRKPLLTHCAAKTLNNCKQETTRLDAALAAILNRIRCAKFT